MNQVTNLPSLGFTQERIANLLGVFPEVVLCDIDFSGFFDVAFDPHIFSIVQHQPKEAHCFHSSPSTSYTGEQFS